MPSPRRSAALALAAVPLLAALIACGPSEQVQQEARADVEELLAAYLPALAEYYRSGDSEHVEGLAAPRERDRVESLIRDRAQEGMVIDATLQRFEIDRFDLYQHSNALLSTREVWDLRIRAAGSDRIIQEELGKTDGYRYQVKRGDDDGWMVLSREVVAPPAGG
jgi:hypothetical protein